MRLEIRPLAVADIDALTQYLAERNPAAARRLLDALRATFERIADHPDAGRPWPRDIRRLPGLRFTQIQGFRNYLVFYQPKPGVVSIVRVLHGARDIPNLLPDE